MKKLILASASPRRISMLNELGIKFLAVESCFRELCYSRKQSPPEYVQKNALGKACNVAGQFDDAVVIGADTVVFCEDRVFGKPDTFEEAYKTMQVLNGKTHEVYTGVAIVDLTDNRTLTDCEKTAVTFRKLTDQEIKSYILHINPLDKAGAYAIQGAGAIIVESIAGCYYNVVGFPLAKIEQMLSGLGVSLFEYMKTNEQ